MTTKTLPPNLAVHEETDEWTDYIPEWRDIRERFEEYKELREREGVDVQQAADEAKPVRMQLRFITRSEMSKFQSEAIAQVGKGKRTKGPRLAAFIKSMLSFCVRGIVNYSRTVRTEEGEGQKTLVIRTGEQLAKHGHPELVDEIMGAIQDTSLIEDGRLEPYRSQSDSSQAGTKPSTATVSVVSEKG